MENTLVQQFRQHMKSAGIELRKSETISQPEKTASVDDMRGRFIENASKEIMATALADMWQDPILGNLLDHGNIKTAAKLAAGRFVDEPTAQKLASLSAEEAHALATKGIQRSAVQKLASVESGVSKPKTNFPSLFGGRS